MNYKMNPRHQGGDMEDDDEDVFVAPSDDAETAYDEETTYDDDFENDFESYDDDANRVMEPFDLYENTTAIGY